MDVENGASARCAEVSKLVIRLSRKINEVDNKLKFLDQTPQNQPQKEAMAVNNVIKIEGIQKELEQIKTQLAELKSSGQIDLHSSNTARWFKTKFESNLQCPESRRYLKDTIDSKLLSFQVLIHPYIYRINK